MLTLSAVLPFVSLHLHSPTTYLHLATLSKHYHHLTPTLPLPPPLLFAHNPRVDHHHSSLDATLHQLPLLATGTYSTTRLLPHPVFPHVQLAVKLLPKRLQIRLDNAQNLGREVHILRALAATTLAIDNNNNDPTTETDPPPHPYTTHIATVQTPSHLSIVTDFVKGGELFTHLHHKHHRTRRPTMDEAKAATPNQHHNALSSCPPQTTQFYMAQLVLAVNHLHTCFPHAAVLHRDLRQENILVSSTSYLKICDFGNARWLKHGTRARTLCGVPESTAPEMFVPNAAGNTTHGTAVDWWALGVLSFELNVGWSPFYSENPMDIYGRILASPNTLHYPDTATKDQEESSAWAQAKSFTLGLLNRDETERLGASTSTKSAMHHAWMKHMEWHELLHQNVVPPRGAFFPSHDVARNFELHAPREEAVPKPLSGAKGKMIWHRWCGDL